MTHAYETIGADRLRAITLADAALWSLAFLAVVGAVGGGTYYAVGQTSPVEPQGAPPPAMMLELAPISMAPPVEEIAAEDGEFSPFEQSAASADALPAEAPDMIEPLELAEASPVEPVETVPPNEALEPLPLETPEPDAPTELVDPAPVEPLEEIIPDIIEAENAEVYVPAPLALPETIAERRRAFAQTQERERQEREERRQEQQRQQAASQQTAPRSVQATPNERTAAPTQTETTQRMPTVSPERWNALLKSHLARHTQYPSESQRRREIGLPYVRIVIDAQGNVTSRRLARSSGYPTLDEAALDMIDRASPVPAPPPNYVGQPFDVPVNFNLRR